jgi:hypothetical protein
MRLTNWSFIRSVGLGHVGADEVPAGVHAAVVRAGGDGDRHGSGAAVGGDVGPVADVAALHPGRVHQGLQRRRRPGALGGGRELVGLVELQDRPLADDVRAQEPQHLLRARVPDTDGAVPVGADDRLLGDGVDDAGHGLGARGQDARGGVQLVGAAPHLLEEDRLLALQTGDVAALGPDPPVVADDGGGADAQRPQEQEQQGRRGGARVQQDDSCRLRHGDGERRERCVRAPGDPARGGGGERESQPAGGQQPVGDRDPADGEDDRGGGDDGRGRERTADRGLPVGSVGEPGGGGRRPVEDGEAHAATPAVRARTCWTRPATVKGLAR